VCRMRLTGAGDDTENKYVYRMDNPERGRLIIINNRRFDAQTQMSERTGTDRDAANLYADFKQLGFSVEVKNDQTASQMLQLMTNGNISHL